MALLVLFLLAGITGFVGYTEAAKIEKRFRRGPSGLPAWMWGVACGLVGLIVGLIASAFVIGALIGFVGYRETKKYEKQSGNELLGVPAYGWAALCFSFVTIGALLSSAFVVGALVAIVGYNEVVVYERQFGRRALRVSSMIWGAGLFFFGLVGALVTSTLRWGVACSFLALVGALVLLFFERSALIAERDALIAERDAMRKGGAPNSSAAPQVAAPPRPPADAAPPQPPDRQLLLLAPPASSGPAPQPSVSRGAGAATSDLLPRRR